MNILLSEQQVALNELYQAIRELVDLYRDSAEFIDSDRIATEFLNIAQQREPLIARFEKEIKSLGILPSEPDGDKETVVMLYDRLKAALSDDDITEFLQQRLTAEQQLARLIADSRGKHLSNSANALLDEMAREIETITARLQKLLLD